MAEVDQLKIRTIYRSFASLKESIRPKGGYSVLGRVVENYDHQIEELSKITRNDYSQYKALGVVESGGINDTSYDSDEFLQILSQLIGILEGQFNLEEKVTHNDAPIISIDNSNRNEITISLKSIKQIASEVDDFETKHKLEELNTQLEQANKDETKITALVVWLAQHAWEVFIASIPYVLDKLSTRIN